MHQPESAVQEQPSSMKQPDSAIQNQSSSMTQPESADQQQSSCMKQRRTIPTYNVAVIERPPEMSFRYRVSKFFYNRQQGTVMRRTSTSWTNILLFYLVFYLSLAAIFAFTMWIFFLRLNPRIPKWTLDSSLIGTSPGLGFRPMPSIVESTLIYYKDTEREAYEYWTNSLDEFLSVYKVPGLTLGRGENIFNCDYDKLPPRGKVCNVDIKEWYPCTQENNYNYHKSAPCIFLKLNKIYMWQPEYYNDTNDLPEKMPDDLKTYIRGINETKHRNNVWVSCQGENSADVEYIGPIKYIPSRGFPGYFYPYVNSEGYLSPLVAVLFENPRSGIVINIECKAWAKNIQHNRHDRVGLVHFELMLG